ncbi:LTA synthase family protein [Bacillus shivajii]|uniref:LTA synthase family protein n=1 Tax=Bacillus shivajii TaxID=1983719 RepID=UPI001CF978D8|nr:LTA synthase family protein [Bacillus shivajii]UCZ53569.1 LTA synthase family protein [Bacillus shivajii]
MQSFFRNHRFMLLFLSVIWLKTFIVSEATFHININQFLEALIFALNPLIFLFTIYSIGLLFKPKAQLFYYFALSMVLSVILYSNVVYYREFSDIITLPMLLMSSNMGDLSTSIFELIHIADILYFIDLALLGFLIYRQPVWLTVTKIQFNKAKFPAIILLLLLAVGLTQLKVVDQKYSFNRDQLIQTLGIYNFYLYDAYLHTLTTTQVMFSEEDDWSSIKEYLEENRGMSNLNYFEAAKDMNVIVVSLESVESFVFGETLNGEEITPFLNELIEESYYFENFYYQTGQGKTSDAEFIINTSLYPLGRGAVFLTHDENEYRGLPEILLNHGYHTATFHANNQSFYNRDVMYPNLGYEDIYSFSDYNISVMNSVGWGMKDIDFVEQSLAFIEELPQPFYGTMLTLTNHFPYELDEEDQFIDEFDSDSEIVNRYFPTVRYTDEAMRVLVEGLKEKGLYENTVLVMYGDHYGIASSHYGELGKFLDKRINMYEAIKLERVPLIVHIPGMEGETIDTVSGQIDVMPTLLNLLGISEENKTMFGSDLFSYNRNDFTVLRDGSVITDDLIYSNDRCFDHETGEELSLATCEPLKEQGARELNFSDKIIYGDLFQFLD